LKPRRPLSTGAVLSTGVVATELSVVVVPVVVVVVPIVPLGLPVVVGDAWVAAGLL
jgi:hypothetical protein